jgi:CRISPR system Cascade subunit CasC
MLIEIHMLQNHAPSNLNRDDTGSVKDAMFGGVRRARISSQAIKRSIRTSDAFKDAFEDEDLGVRTKYMPEMIKQLLLERGVSESKADSFVTTLTKVGGEKKPKAVDGKLITSQLMFLSMKDMRAIADNYEELSKTKEKELAKNIRKVVEENSSVPVDVALFGRMTTNQPVKDINCCCQVAHAISANRHSVEFDYFTAVDDLSKGFSDEPGAGHVGETEFSSALFYKYFSVDFSSLEEMLEDGKTAVKAVKALMKGAVYANPTGKQNSFASHVLPHFIGIEIKDRKIPVNYCNAFCEPIQSGAGWLGESVDRISRFAIEQRDLFSLPVKNAVWFSSVSDKELTDFSEKRVKNIDELLDWLDGAVS